MVHQTIKQPNTIAPIIILLLRSKTAVLVVKSFQKSKLLYFSITNQYYVHRWTQVEKEEVLGSIALSKRYVNTWLQSWCVFNGLQSWFEIKMRGVQCKWLNLQ